MTFKEIVDDALDKTGYDSTATTSEPRTRFKRLVNQWQRRIVGNPLYSKLRDGKIPFATVASQPQYGIPIGLARIDRIYDATLNNPRLSLASADWIRWDPQAAIATGTPQYYANLGAHPIFRLPAITGTGIWVASSSATDGGGGAITVSCDFTRVGGYPHLKVAASTNGTTRVQFGTRTDFIDVTRIILSAAPVGDITLYDAATAGNVLGVIPMRSGAASGQTFSGPQYTVIQLCPVPSSIITYTIEGQLEIRDMIEDYEEPMLPLDHHLLLSVAAEYQELRDVKKQLAQARELRMDLTVLENTLLDWLINTPDYLPVPNDGRGAARGSNLGGWFPAGRW